MSRLAYFSFLDNKQRLEFEHGRVIEDSEFGKYVAEEKKKDHLTDIKPRNNGNDGIGLLFANHTPEQLSDAMLRYTQQTYRDTKRPYKRANWLDINHANMQASGIAQYRQAQPAPMKGPPNDGVPSKADVQSKITQYYDAFDKMFFYGSLKNLCTVQMMMDGDDRGLLGTCSSQFYDGRQDIPAGSACLIKIAYPHQTAEADRMQDYMFVYAETLLHEMVHAYFDIYACRCAKICEEHTVKLLASMAIKECGRRHRC